MAAALLLPTVGTLETFSVTHWCGCTQDDPAGKRDKCTANITVSFEFISGICAGAYIFGRWGTSWEKLIQIKQKGVLIDGDAFLWPHAVVKSATIDPRGTAKEDETSWVVTLLPLEEDLIAKVGGINHDTFVGASKDFINGIRYAIKCIGAGVRDGCDRMVLCRRNANNEYGSRVSRVVGITKVLVGGHIYRGLTTSVSK